MNRAGYPPPPFAHLVRLTDRGGLHEHAEWTRPRAEHGYCLDDVTRALVVTGLFLLGWLLDRETRDGHLSVTPVGGSGPADTPRPRYDQQPIEVAALSDACARAFTVTADPRWAQGVHLAARWFLGHNDGGVALVDPASGGGCDGLQAGGRNENQGAESTIALITALQQVRALALCTA